MDLFIVDLFLFFFITGLDDSMYNYVYSFINNGVGGHQLLNIRPYELEQLGMNSIGHQEIVLEAVENLRNFVSTSTIIIIFADVLTESSVSLAAL